MPRGKLEDGVDCKELGGGKGPLAGYSEYGNEF
jgi:hypothetical protein